MLLHKENDHTFTDDENLIFILKFPTFYERKSCDELVSNTMQTIWNCNTETPHDWHVLWVLDKYCKKVPVYHDRILRNAHLWFLKHLYIMFYKYFQNLVSPLRLQLKTTF